MPILTGSSVTCSDVELITQMTLAQIAGDCYPYNISNLEIGAYNAVNASLDVAGVARIDDNILRDKERPKPGSRAKIKIKYRTKRCIDAVDCDEDYDQCDANHCPDYASNIDEEQCAEVEIGRCVKAGFGLCWDDFRAIVDNRRDALARNLNETYEALMRSLNAKYRDALIAGAGNYFTGDCNTPVDSVSAPKTLYLMRGDMTPNPLGAYPIKNQYTRMGTDKTIFALGGSYLDLYATANQLDFSACCAPAPQLQGTNFRTDYSLDAAYGDGLSHVITWLPGSVHVIQWRDYENEWRTDAVLNNTFDLGAAIGRPSLIVDQAINVSGCGKAVSWEFRVNHELLKIPFAEAMSLDCGQCYDFCLHWLASCGDMTCADAMTC